MLIIRFVLCADVNWFISWILGVVYLIGGLVFPSVSVGIFVLVLVSCWLLLVNITMMFGFGSLNLAGKTPIISNKITGLNLSSLFNSLSHDKTGQMSHSQSPIVGLTISC